MELAYYEITYRRDPHAVYSKMSVYCHGEFEAIEKIKQMAPEAVIISVKKK